MDMEIPLELPTCMIEAWELIEEDRAFVGILVLENDVHVVSSKGTVEQLRQLPQALPFLSPDTDQYTRASFLISGVHEVAISHPE